MKKSVAAMNRVPKMNVKKLNDELKAAKAKLKATGSRRGRGRGRGTVSGRGTVGLGTSKGEKAVRTIERKLAKAKKEVIEGAITLGNISLLEQYYGNAIRGNTGNLQAMTKACWAVFYHSVSTDEHPQHQHCPVSWCKYSQALAADEDVPSHHTTIPKGFIPFVKPVFNDLCKKELLEKCLMGATQNRNESFNALVWARAPKTEFCSLASVQIATSLACITFNSGSCGLTDVMKRLNLQAGPLCTAYLSSRDAFRVKRAELKEAEVAKNRRKSKRIAEVRTEEGYIEEEGPTYGRGEF